MVLFSGLGNHEDNCLATYFFAVVSHLTRQKIHQIDARSLVFPDKCFALCTFPSKLFPETKSLTALYSDTAFLYTFGNWPFQVLVFRLVREIIVRKMCRTLLLSYYDWRERAEAQWKDICFACRRSQDQPVASHLNGVRYQVMSNKFIY